MSVKFKVERSKFKSEGEVKLLNNIEKQKNLKYLKQIEYESLNYKALKYKNGYKWLTKASTTRINVTELNKRCYVIGIFVESKIYLFYLSILFRSFLQVIKKMVHDEFYDPLSDYKFFLQTSCMRL